MSRRCINAGSEWSRAAFGGGELLKPMVGSRSDAEMIARLRGSAFHLLTRSHQFDFLRDESNNIPSPQQDTASLPPLTHPPAGRASIPTVSSSAHNAREEAPQGLLNSALTPAPVDFDHFQKCLVLHTAFYKTAAFNLCFSIKIFH